MASIRKFSNEDLKQLFASPVQQIQPLNTAQTVDLIGSLQQRQNEEKQRQFTREQKIAEVERLLAKKEEENKFASLVGQEAGAAELDQQRNAINPGQAGPEIGPLTPDAQAGVTRAQDLAEAAARVNPTAFAKPSTTGDSELRGRDIQQFALVSPEGKRRLLSFVETAEGGKGALVDVLTGQIVTDQERQQLSEQGWIISRTDPQLKSDAAGNLLAVDPTRPTSQTRVSTGAETIRPDQFGTVTEVNHELIPKTDRSTIIKEITSTKNDPIVRSALKLIPMTDNVEDFLTLDNKVAVDRLGGLTQKLVATDSGNLAAWEQRDPGSRDIVRRIRQWASMNTTGLLADTNKEEMVQILKIMRKNVGENMNRIVDITLDNLTGLYPQLNREAFREKMGVANVAENLKGGADRDALKNKIREKLKQRT